MAEFLCDTMPDRNYDEPDDYYGIGFDDRYWGHIPQRAYSGITRTTRRYVIPISSRDGPLRPEERARIELLGIDYLASLIYIREPLVYMDYELLGLLDAYDYARGDREPWWTRRGRRGGVLV